MATDPFMDLNDPEPEAPAAPPSIEAPAETAPEPAPEAAQPPAPAPVVASEPTPEVAAAPAPAAAAPPATPAAPASSKAARGKKGKAPVEAAPAGEIDLTNALGGLTSDDELGGGNGTELDKVFHDFRNEVTKQSGADQSVQHMTIARAYIEMGLTDDAIPALKTAAKSPSVRFEAASTLARLYRQRGEQAPAIEWFERAAEAPAPTVDDGRALLYELGTTLEEAGETARALAVFLELQAEGSEYRDVASRAERLAGMQSGG
jgi:tetratricopeptide (TPR) repeat protein